MRLTSQLTVDAPLERTWPALLELGGPVRAQLGAEYEGTAGLDDADEDEHAAGFHAQGRETGGHGLAAATIAARLSDSDEGTRIAVETELRLTGAARTEQAALQAAADDLLARVAAHLKLRLDETAPPAPAPGSEPPQAALPEAAADPLAVEDLADGDSDAEPLVEDLAWEHPEAERSVADLARELLATELPGSDPSGAPGATRSQSAGLKGSEPLGRQLDVWAAAGKVAERALLVVAGVALGLAVGRVIWRGR